MMAGICKKMDKYFWILEYERWCFVSMSCVPGM